MNANTALTGSARKTRPVALLSSGRQVNASGVGLGFEQRTRIEGASHAIGEMEVVATINEDEALGSAELKGIIPKLGGGQTGNLSSASSMS